MKTSIVKSLIAACVLGAPLQASAGQFSVACQHKTQILYNGCGENVRDIVTDKFTDRYPKHDIFVLSDHIQFSDGSYVVYARAGVSPRGTFEAPRYNFSAFRTVAASHENTALAMGRAEARIVRDVVQDMMDECATSKNCDSIYVPYSE